MLLVLLSLSLGFLNLLPIPILDGGQIVFQIVEWAKGRPLSDRTMMVGQQAGLLLLVLLMGVALVQRHVRHRCTSIRTKFNSGDRLDHDGSRFFVLPVRFCWRRRCTPRRGPRSPSATSVSRVCSA